MKGITLIGMPGSGKSTIGKFLAEKLQWQFVDLDLLILEKTGLSHDRILEEQGKATLLSLENEYTLDLPMSGVVFSPGGSIVYSVAAMKKLINDTTIIYFDVPLAEIKRRLGDNRDNSRGIVDFKEKGLDGLFAERTPLLQSSAHHTVACAGLSESATLEAVLALIKTEI